MPTAKRFTDEELRAHKNARSRERYRENKERIAEYHKQHHAKKSADPAYREKLRLRSAAYRIAKPEMVVRQNARKREQDPEGERARCREWFAANPEKRVIYQQNRRAKIVARGGRLSPDLTERLMKLQRGRCAICRAKLDRPHTDHIMPLALGGEHKDANMQLLCQPCNQSKHAKHPVDFMQKRGFLL